MKTSHLLPALFLVCSSGFAANPAPDAATPPKQVTPDAFPLRRLGIEFADLVFIVFIGQTSQSLTALDVNEIPIRFDDDDDPHAFDYLLKRP